MTCTYCRSAVQPYTRCESCGAPPEVDTEILEVDHASWWSYKAATGRELAVFLDGVNVTEQCMYARSGYDGVIRGYLVVDGAHTGVHCERRGHVVIRPA